MASLQVPEPAYEEGLVDGVAAWLAAQGVASWDGGPDGPLEDAYTEDTEWPIHLGPNMPTSPDALIMLTAVARVFTGAGATRNTQLQFWIRGPRVTESAEEKITDRDARDAVVRKWQQIHDLFTPHARPLVYVTFGSVRIGGVFPVNGEVQTADPARRYSHVSNYRFRGRRV